jgi:hypothetical protein
MKSVDRIQLNDELLALISEYGWTPTTEQDESILDELTHHVANTIECLLLPDDHDSIPGMDLFVLRIRLGNAGMKTREDIAQALGLTSLNVEDGTTTGRAILDVNGNTVGSWALHERAS